MPSTKTVTWDGVSSTTIPTLRIGQVWRSLHGQSRGTYVELPNRAGGYHFNSRPGLRTIRLGCHIEAADADARNLAIEDVADWLDVDYEAKLIISDRSDVFYRATLSTPPDPDEWREFAEFEIQFTAQPYSEALLTTVESWASGTNENHVWDPSLLVPVYPVIEITPTNGTLTDFTVETNGDTMSFVGANVNSGSTVTINSIVPIVLAGQSNDADLTGYFDPVNTYLLGVSGEFPILVAPGNNNVHLIVTGGTATTINMKVTYRKAYRK